MRAYSLEFIRCAVGYSVNAEDMATGSVTNTVIAAVTMP
jgi:hypothetical protein